MKDNNEIKQVSGFLLGAFLKVFVTQLTKKHKEPYSFEEILDTLAEVNLIAASAVAGISATYGHEVPLLDCINSQVDLLYEEGYILEEGDKGYIHTDSIVERFPSSHPFMKEVRAFQEKSASVSMMTAMGKTKNLHSFLLDMLSQLKDRTHSEVAFHDCDTCDKKGDCPIEGTIRALKAKEADTKEEVHKIIRVSVPNPSDPRNVN